MEDCRHPITEAGIGPLLDTLAKRWAVELNPDESKVTFNDDMVVGPNRCTMIESTHPIRRPEFLHYRVRVFIDQDLGLPIRFEAYDWPKRPQAEPELLEEYTYMHLKLNVGLRDIDFDVSNSPTRSAASDPLPRSDCVRCTRSDSMARSIVRHSDGRFVH